MRGLDVAKTMFALVLAMGILTGVGFSQIASVNLGSGGLDVQDAEEISGGVSEPEVEDFGGESPSNFGVTTGATSVLTGLWVVVTETGPILQSWGVPPIIATSVHLMAILSFGLAVLAFLRGVTNL